MPDWNAPLDDWIKFYSPESYSVVGVEREVPVHRFLSELKALREAVAPFVQTAINDIGQDEIDEDIFQPIHHHRAPQLTVGNFRKLVELSPPPIDDSTN